MTTQKRAQIKRIKCCWFCGLVEYRVSVLIQGACIAGESPVHICGDCVKVCAELVTQHETEGRREDEGV